MLTSEYLRAKTLTINNKKQELCYRQWPTKRYYSVKKKPPGS